MPYQDGQTCDGKLLLVVLVAGFAPARTVLVTATRRRFVKEFHIRMRNFLTFAEYYALQILKFCNKKSLGYRKFL